MSHGKKCNAGKLVKKKKSKCFPNALPNRHLQIFPISQIHSYSCLNQFLSQIDPKSKLVKWAPCSADHMKVIDWSNMSTSSPSSWCFFSHASNGRTDLNFYVYHEHIIPVLSYDINQYISVAVTYILVICFYLLLVLSNVVTMLYIVAWCCIVYCYSLHPFFKKMGMIFTSYPLFDRFYFKVCDVIL